MVHAPNPQDFFHKSIGEKACRKSLEKGGLLKKTWKVIGWTSITFKADQSDFSLSHGKLEYNAVQSKVRWD